MDEESMKSMVCAWDFVLLHRYIGKQKKKIFYCSSSCWFHFSDVLASEKNFLACF